MLFGGSIELFRVKQARAGRFHRRRRVNDDDIVPVTRALEEAAAVIHYDAAFGIPEHLRRVGVVEPEGVLDTADQLHHGGLNVPAQRRAIGRAHAETDHQGGGRPAPVKGQRQVDHELGLRR